MAKPHLETPLRLRLNGVVLCRGDGKTPVLQDDDALSQYISRMRFATMLMQGHRDRAHDLRLQIVETRSRAFEARMIAQSLRARFQELSAQRRALAQP